MKSIFEISTEKYDAWYDSEDGRPLYESELLCLKPFIEEYIKEAGFLCIEVKKIDQKEEPQ